MTNAFGAATTQPFCKPLWRVYALRWFVRTKTADAILASVGRFCQRTSNSDR